MTRCPRGLSCSISRVCRRGIALPSLRFFLLLRIATRRCALIDPFSTLHASYMRDIFRYLYAPIDGVWEPRKYCAGSPFPNSKCPLARQHQTIPSSRPAAHRRHRGESLPRMASWPPLEAAASLDRRATRCEALPLSGRLRPLLCRGERLDTFCILLLSMSRAAEAVPVVKRGAPRVLRSGYHGADAAARVGGTF